MHITVDFNSILLNISCLQSSAKSVNHIMKLTCNIFRCFRVTSSDNFVFTTVFHKSDSFFNKSISGGGGDGKVKMELATYENSEPFIPEIQGGKVVRVYDGDTITISARIIIDGVEIPKIFRFNVRIRGIDSPELKTKNPKEKALAIQSRDRLAGFIMNDMVTLENVDYDKYGRILADVKTKDGTNVSSWMLENKLAVEYDGGKKIVQRNGQIEKYS